MIPSRRDTHRLRNFIAILSLFCGFFSASIWIVNSNVVWKHVLSIVNVRSSWIVDVGSFELDPFGTSLRIERLSLRNRNTDKAISINDLGIRIRPLGILRGKLVFDELKLSGVKLSLPSQKRKIQKKRKRLEISKLILFKNLIIDEGLISQLSISFGKNAELFTDEIRLSLESGILKRTELKLRTDGLVISKNGDAKISAGMLNLDTSTELSKWHTDFPYANDLNGQLKASDINAEGLMIDEISATAAYRDYIVGLRELSLTVGGRNLAGSMRIDTKKENFDIDINIEKPIPLPHIVRPMKTLDTAGSMSGNISLSGKGFIPSTTDGDGEIRITHAFGASTDVPITVATGVSWRDGVFNLRNARLVAGDDIISVAGKIDTRAKVIDLQAKGERFPIEFIFDKFRNPHLSKIFGASDCTASFKGWGRKFDVHVSGTTFDGGWNQITAPIIRTELDATFDKLILDSTIMAKERETGKSNLEVAFGPKTKGVPRHKEIKFKAKVEDHPLETSFEAYGLTGRGTGTIEINGPSKAFKGEATAKIRDGSLKNINFERASAKIDISNRKLLFHDLDLALLRIPTDTPGDIEADITPGQVHFYGSPIPELNLDATYLSSAKRWRIKEISWNKGKDQNAVASGSISAAGPIDLKITGRADIAVFKPFLTTIRGGNGLVDVDLDIRGRTQNPQIFGDIKFNKNYLTLRNIQLVLENLMGSLKFNGNKVSFENVVASSEDGSLKLEGWFEHANLMPKAADVFLTGDAMRYRTKDKEFNIEFEGSLSLKGNFPQPNLSGNISILDGRYTRDFNIIDKLTKDKSEPPPPKRGGLDDTFDPKLDLHVQNSGDLEIKNNIGEIYLSANIDIKGTRKKPIVSGSITSNEGEIDYLGLLFDITKGFVEFRADYEKPYIELHGQRELGVYNINIVLHGTMDNLDLDLSATSPSGPLEKRDVVSLILFGMTEDEREYYSRTNRGDMTTSLVAKSVTSVVERPVTKYTRLDVFRLEASDPEKRHVSRLYMGKQLSDRLSINFATDINTNEAEQTVIAEYLLTDNLLIRGSRSTDQKSEFSGLLRFRMR